MALHLAPTGDRVDGAPGSPLRAKVRLSNGRHVAVNVAASEAAVTDRGKKLLAAPTSSAPCASRSLGLSEKVVSVKPTGGTATSRFDIRAIDLSQRRQHRRH